MVSDARQLRRGSAAIVDVSDPAQAALIDSNAQELTGDWRGY